MSVFKAISADARGGMRRKKRKRDLEVPWLV
jgi:hypothetical protein